MELDEILEALIPEFEITRDALTCELDTLDVSTTELEETLEILSTSELITLEALTWELDTVERETVELEDTRESVTVEPDTSEALT